MITIKMLRRGGLLLFIIAAIFGEGHHHPDEHFQILEFAGYLANRSLGADLPWEFAAQIRPALQPELTYCFFQFLREIGLYDPFFAVFLLRLFTALGTWKLWTILAEQWGPRVAAVQGERLLLLLGFGLWFMPYLAARFSSEQVSALCFWAAVAWGGSSFEENTRISTVKLFGLGILLGLSFCFRFQMAFALAGLGAWLLWKRRLSLSAWAVLIFGGLLSLMVSVLADRLFYGNWVFTPYQYFAANILEGKAANWGLEPFWYYAKALIEKAIPPLSLLLLLFMVVGAWRLRTSAWIWVLLFFVLGHSAIGHKELRFLFPILPAFLLASASGFSYLDQRWRNRKIWRMSLQICFWINALLLIVRSVLPANEFVAYQHFLYRAAQKGPLLLYAEKESPYRIVGLETHVYQPENIRVKLLSTLDSLPLMPMPGSDTSVFLLCRRPNLKTEITNVATDRVFRLFPDFIFYNNTNGWQERSNIWSVYRLGRKRLGK